MYFNDHNPPHFHALYAGKKAIFAIKSLEIIEGNLPPRVIGFIVEWALKYNKELLANWELMKENNGIFNKIGPLV